MKHSFLLNQCDHSKDGKRDSITNVSQSLQANIRFLDVETNLAVYFDQHHCNGGEEPTTDTKNTGNNWGPIFMR